MKNSGILRKRFDPQTAVKSHEGTILASGVAPDGFPAPFQHAYGYLGNGGAMAGHAHSTEEVYLVLAGSGIVVVGGRNRAVQAGDTVVIPAGQWHTMLCTERDKAPFLWAALWWEPVGKRTVPDGEIQVRRFSHSGADRTEAVIPEGLPAPFANAYRYLEAGGVMEAPGRPAREILLVYSGCGHVTVGDRTEPVEAGDVIAVPTQTALALAADAGDPLLWAAFWWDTL